MPSTTSAAQIWTSWRSASSIWVCGSSARRGRAVTGSQTDGTRLSSICLTGGIGLFEGEFGCHGSTLAAGARPSPPAGNGIASCACRPAHEAAGVHRETLTERAYAGPPAWSSAGTVKRSGRRLLFPPNSALPARRRSHQASSKARTSGSRAGAARTMSEIRAASDIHDAPQDPAPAARAAPDGRTHRDEPPRTQH